MHMYQEADRIAELVQIAEHIVVIQADNPDSDSLGSALALEHVFGDLGKKVTLYCGVDIPAYLRYMKGWDRVQRDIPKQFDASVIVDATTMTLLEKLKESGQHSWLATKPCIILDHHEVVENTVPFATITINDHTRSSASELVYTVSKQLKWPLSVEAQTQLMSGILGDTQGLSNKLASSDTYRIMAEMIDAGVSRPDLEEIRREYSKMPLEIYQYKADLIKRTGFAHNNNIAWVVIPQQEINQFSPLYNPAPLIQGDMLQTDGVRVAIVFKQYDDGRVTGAIRTNPAYGIAAKIAEFLGGGGHANASGFKVTDGRSIEDIKSACLGKAGELLDEQTHEAKDEAV